MSTARRVSFVRSLFDSIASRYDLTNQIITLGQIGRWRSRTAREAQRTGPRLVLDLGTGTGEIALALLKKGSASMRVIGVDVSAGMLRLGRQKVKRRNLEERVSFLLADADALPFKDGTVDCLVDAFFLRHLPDLAAAFAEFHRVLAGGGRIISLELSQDPAPLFRSIFRLWFRRLVPLIGGWVSGNRRAYDYLPRSLDVFPNSEGLLELMREGGFLADYEKFALGMVAISRGVK